jgi:hypothetical protein
MNVHLQRDNCEASLSIKMDGAIIAKLLHPTSSTVCHMCTSSRERINR